jgi:hypothetical protein
MRDGEAEFKFVAWGGIGVGAADEGGYETIELGGAG